MSRFFYKYDLSYEYTDVFGKEGLEWLRNLNLPAIDKQTLQSNLQILETLNSEIRNADIQIAKDAVHEEQTKLLMTMPGVDYYAAMILLSEIGDVKRFASPEKLASWVGLAPQVHQSSDTQWTGHITRKGSKRARWILTQCAQSARQHDPRMRQFYERIEQKHGSSKAVVAVADKMLAIMHVSSAEPYMRALRLLAQKDCISLSEYARLVLEEHVREMAVNSIQSVAFLQRFHDLEKQYILQRGGAFQERGAALRYLGARRRRRKTILQ